MTHQLLGERLARSSPQLGQPCGKRRGRGLDGAHVLVAEVELGFDVDRADDRASVPQRHADLAGDVGCRLDVVVAVLRADQHRFPAADRRADHTTRRWDAVLHLPVAAHRPAPQATAALQIQARQRHPRFHEMLDDRAGRLVDRARSR